MEFHEKLQELRKQKNLTQEELSEMLFVSRTDISKWESGRGYPSIDSLKAIAQFFGITIDDLLSNRELICIAEEDSCKKTQHMRDLVFGLLDCSIGMLFFLPLFGQQVNGIIYQVPLLSLENLPLYIKSAYFAVILLTALMLCIIPTAIMQFNRLISCEKIRYTATALCSIYAALMVIGRILSGVHWISDILGGILLSATLVMFYYSIVSAVCKEI